MAKKDQYDDKNLPNIEIITSCIINGDKCYGRVDGKLDSVGQVIPKKDLPTDVWKTLCNTTPVRAKETDKEVGDATHIAMNGEVVAFEDFLDAKKKSGTRQQPPAPAKPKSGGRGKPKAKTAAPAIPGGE